MNEYKYWIHTLPLIGDVTIRRLLGRYGTALKVYEAFVVDEPGVKAILGKIRLDEDKIAHVIKAGRSKDPLKEYEKLKRSEIRFITVDDEDYPLRLRGIKGEPYAIYVIGDLPGDDVPAVSIIGARSCSEYGRYVANSFGERLGEAGINVISGMALGVDGIGQRGAVNAGGKTFAVLGSGVDICYPEENRDLYEKIPQNGGIISSFPPGSKPQKQFFPERNRLVAALGDSVLVIEARQKSGTGITVSLALSMNKDVYAVPGRITDRLSDGCNMLISQGAGVALSPEDFVSEIKMLWNRNGGTKGISGEKQSRKLNTDLTIDRPFIKLEAAGNVSGFLKYVDPNPLSAQQIHSNRLKDEPGADISDTFACLASLAVEGSIVQVGSGYYYKVL